MSLIQKQEIIIKVTYVSVPELLLFKGMKLSGKFPISVKETCVSLK